MMERVKKASLESIRRLRRERCRGRLNNIKFRHIYGIDGIEGERVK